MTATLLKNRLQHGRFLINLEKWATFLQNTYGRLLLYDGNNDLKWNGTKKWSPRWGLIKSLFLRRQKNLQIWNEQHNRWKTAARNTTKILKEPGYSMKNIYNYHNMPANLWLKNHYTKKLSFTLTLSWRRSLSYRNQFIDLQSYKELQPRRETYLRLCEAPMMKRFCENG